MEVDRLIESEGLLYRGGKFWVELKGTAWGNFEGSPIEQANFRHMMRVLPVYRRAFTLMQWSRDSIYARDGNYQCIGKIPQEDLLCIVESGRRDYVLWGDAGSQKVWDAIQTMEEEACLNLETLAVIHRELEDEYIRGCIPDLVLTELEFYFKQDVPEAMHSQICREARNLISEWGLEFKYAYNSAYLPDDRRVVQELLSIFKEKMERRMMKP